MSLENVQAGDILVLRTYGIGGGRTLVKIERTTKTQLITSRNRRFRKADGYLIGPRASGLPRSRVLVPTEGEFAAVRAGLRHALLVTRINVACERNNLKKLSLRTLERIRRVLGEEDAI